ncbi:MAG TPA: copper resistance system multicopper oxidase [Steroidobacteraceae bacterium]|nr:copper resistance system multicopper oxidase [Steroidobacteraceae bacterium]
MLSRRRFVQGVGGAGLLLGAGGWSRAGASEPGVLVGPDFDLTIDTLPVNFSGTARRAVAVNGSVPGPLLRMRQGDTVTMRIRNRLRERTSIHWHGLIVPADMDGVPGLSFDGIAPGSTFTYRFKVNQSGTYWYHSHSRFQEQVGLYGPLIVERRAGERHAADREHVLLLSDWTDLDPEHVYATLKRQSDYYNFNKRTVGDFLDDVRKQGWDAAQADRRMWGRMRMDPTDLADVGGYAYTYLLNGTTPAGNWTGIFRPGERVRLRIINGSSMSFFDLRIPGLKLTVVAADGQDVEPVTVDELRIGTAEVYDVIVEPRDAAYTIFAQAMDRSGFARGTLAPRAGMVAEVPELDAPALLTMADMGMHHEGMDHSQMSRAPLNHAPAEDGPIVDMKAGMVAPRLDDPGVGLRDNGRRVLTYADLATLGGAIDSRDAAREIELHLTGHMERYIWSFNGQKFSDATPLEFTHGERLRITLVNDSMMTHPIHLHGMWSEIVDARGAFAVRKHTVSIQPAQRLSYLVTADALGSWAYHCHLLYHMEAGMFREVVVA